MKIRNYTLIQIFFSFSIYFIDPLKSQEVMEPHQCPLTKVKIFYRESPLYFHSSGGQFDNQFVLVLNYSRSEEWVCNWCCLISNIQYLKTYERKSNLQRLTIQWRKFGCKFKQEMQGRNFIYLLLFSSFFSFVLASSFHLSLTRTSSFIIIFFFKFPLSFMEIWDLQIVFGSRFSFVYLFIFFMSKRNSITSSPSYLLYKGFLN